MLAASEQLAAAEQDIRMVRWCSMISVKKKLIIIILISVSQPVDRI
jgi:hypothetical protein